MYHFKSLTNASSKTISGRDAGFIIEAQGTPIFDESESFLLGAQTPFVTEVNANTLLKTGPHRFALEGAASPGIYQERYTFAGDETRVFSVEYALSHNLNHLATSGQVLRVILSFAEVRIEKLPSGLYGVLFFTFANPAASMTLSLPDTLVFRFTRTPDDQLVPCIFHEGRWISGVTSPLAGVSHAGPFEMVVRLNGTSDPAGNGEVTPIHLKTFPVFYHQHWYDGHPSTLPICTSISGNRAFFQSYNLCYGEFEGALLYGCGAGFSETAEVEPFTSIRPDRNGDELAMVTSVVSALYSDDSPPAICPLRGVPASTNRGNGEVYNTCFDDGSAQDGSAATYQVVAAGAVLSRDKAPAIAMLVDGQRLGASYELRRTQLPTNYLAGPLRSSYSRCLPLSNGDVVYYGVDGGAGVDDYDETAELEVSYSFDTLPGGDVLVDMESDVRILRVGDDTPIFSQSYVTAVSTTTSETVRLRCPRGHYYIEHRVTLSGEAIGASFSATVSWIDPGTLVPSLMASFEKDATAPRSNPLLTRCYFDYNHDEKGRLWALYHDVSEDTVSVITLTPETHLAHLGTKSIAAFEGPGSLVHFCYLETSLDLRESQLDPRTYINVSTYNHATTAVQTGSLIYLPAMPSNSSVWAFDACVLNGQLTIYYSVAQGSNQSYTRKARRIASTDIYGQRSYEYIDLPLEISSYPHLSRTLRITATPVSAINLSSTDASRFTMPASTEYAVESLEVALQMREFWDTNEAEIASVSYREEGYYAGAQEIKCQPSNDHNSTVVSVIEQSRRLPFILAGSGTTIREVTLPPFFDIAYNQINQLRPVESLEACWNIDGDILALATTLQAEDMQGFVNPSSQPHAELMSIDPSILSSQRDRFFEFDMDQSWVGEWKLVSAYRSPRRLETHPILNAHYDQSARVFDYAYSIEEGVWITTYADRVELPARYIDNLSLTRDKNFMRISASGSAYQEPALYESQYADVFPFSVPAHTAYHPSFLDIDPPVVLTSPSAVTNFTTGATTVQATGFITDIIGDDKSYRSRQFDGSRGARARFTISMVDALASVDTDGYELALHDNSAASGDPTTEGLVRALITKPLAASTYTVTFAYYDAFLAAFQSFGTAELEPNVIVDIDLACKNINDSRYDYLATIKPRDAQDGFEYSKTYTTTCEIHNAGLKDSFSIGLDWLYWGVTSLHLASSDTAISIHEVQLGDLSLDPGPRKPVDASPPTYGQNPFAGARALIRNDSPVFSLAPGHARTSFNMAATAGNVSCEIYYPNGFRSRFSGSSLLTSDSFTLSRETISTPTSLLSSNLHGSWRATSATPMIWADAQDSGLAYFVFDTIILKGKNFKDYQIVVRDSTLDPWQTIAAIDSSHTRYRSLVNRRYDNSTVLDAEMTIYPDHDAMLDRATWAHSIDTLKVRALDDEAIVCDPPALTLIERVLSPFAPTERIATPALALPARTTSLPDGATTHLSFDVSLYSSDHFHRLSEPRRARYVGILVPAQQLPDGSTVELETFDIGYASDLIDPLPDNARGFDYEYDSDVVYLIDNQVSEDSVKNVSKAYNLTYSVTRASNAYKLESILSKISLRSRPIWVIEDVNDPDSCRLALVEGDLSREMLIDEEGNKAFSLSMKLKAVE